MSYKAFISYSHAADGKLAPALQLGLHRFARPWYRLRAIRVFRDDTNLSISPGLWSSIEQALGESDFFLLLASPQAATSKWVSQEVGFWLEHRSSQTLLIILTDGNLVWDSEIPDVNWSQTTALPPSLTKVFTEEPLYLDLRWAKTVTDLSLNNPAFRDKIADLASTLHGRPKDELIGVDVQQHRKVKLLTWSAVIALALLSLTAVVGALVAVQEKNVAQARRIVSIAQALTAQAPQQQRAFKQDERAALLARQAYLFNEQSHGHFRSQITDTLRTVLGVPFFSQILTGHNDRVWAVALSADGQRLASGSLDGSVRLWNLRGPSDEPAILRGHTLGITSVVFSPDGKRLASAAEDGTVRIWDVEHPLASASLLKAESGRVWSVAFSADGERLAAGGDDATVRLWELKRPEQPIAFVGHAKPITSVAFAPDGWTLASTSYDMTIRLWDVRQPGASPRILRGHTSTVRGVAISPSGRLLASAAEDSTMRVWDLLKPNAAPVAIEHPAIVSAVAFSPDGLRLASACDDGSVRVWNPADLKARPALLRGHDDRVWSIALSRGKLATASDDMSVRVYELEPSRVAPTVLRADQGKVQAVAFGPDGQILASGGDDNIVRVWKVDQGDALPALLRGHQQAVISVAIGADGRTLASADYDGVVRIWDLKHQDMPPFVLPDPGGVTVAFSPDGKKLASAGNKEVRLRDIQELNASPSILSGHENWVSSVAFSRDSHILASASLDNTIRLWDMQHPAAEATLLRGHENQVWSVAFSPDSQWIASGSHDKTVRIWNLAKPDKLPITLRGHEGKVRAVAVSSDSNTIASGGADKTIRLWDPHQPGEDPAMLTGHASEVTSLSFSPDGRRLASGSEDGTVRIWIANSVALADMVCEMVRRNLTGEEWDRFVGADIPYQRTCPNLPSGVISAPLKQGVDERPATPALLFPGDHAVFDHFPRTMTLRWAASPGAATYTVEVQFQGTIWVLVPHISATSYTLEFVGAQPGKWRVWSVGTTGEESAKSNWRDFRFTR